jgi:hypothetical protein
LILLQEPICPQSEMLLQGRSLLQNTPQYDIIEVAQRIERLGAEIDAKELRNDLLARHDTSIIAIGCLHIGRGTTHDSSDSSTLDQRIDY